VRITRKRDRAQKNFYLLPSTSVCFKNKKSSNVRLPTWKHQTSLERWLESLRPPKTTTFEPPLCFPGMSVAVNLTKFSVGRCAVGGMANTSRGSVN
jgi:hypothetical protein